MEHSLWRSCTPPPCSQPTPGRVRLCLILSLVTMASVAAGAADATPVLAKLSAGSPDANYLTTVTASPGAVDPSADVALVTLETGHYATTRAAADGSFSATIFAPRGTSILVKSDPEHAHVFNIANASPPLINSHLHALLSLHGTIVPVQTPPAMSGVAFATAGVDPSLNQAIWIAEGTINRQQFSPGEVVEARGTFTFLLSNLSAATNPRVQAGLTLELLSDSTGAPATAWAFFDSAVTTPTGLAIERFPSFDLPFGPHSSMTIQADKATVPFAASFTVPADFRAGYYLPRLGFANQGIPQPPVDQNVRRTTFVAPLRGRPMPLIRIGSPSSPRLPATLLMNDLAEGARGSVAIEDRGRYAPTSHIAMASDVTIVPRTDPKTGALHRYRFEPFTLTMGVDDRGGPPGPATIPFRFPSGSLTVTLRAPSGATRTLGPAPFRQWHLVSASNRGGHELEGGPHICDPFELRTMDPSFEVTFAEDGRHVVTMNGSIDDLWGNQWRLDGAYEINVARPLVIDSAVLPATPFETTNNFTPAMELIPPVPADVEVRVRHAVRSALPVTDTRFSGKASRFGRFSPAYAFAFTEAGEYRVDVVATYRDAGGVLWMGARTWGGVVAPKTTPLIAHGRRGIDAQQGEKQQWFFRSQTGDPIGDHVHFPFHGGDVAWLQESDSAIPTLTFQDTEGSTAANVTRLWRATRPPNQAGAINELISKGEIPLFSAN